MVRPLVFLFLACLSAGAGASVPSPHAIDVPKWFSESFLDFREDIREATQEKKRLMVYFGQDGCPYCKALMKVNFGDPGIVARTRRDFVAVALNIWGDREVTWIDGRKMPEKELAVLLKVQYTPTLLFFDEKGRVALRLNGWQPPERFRIALDYAALRGEKRPSYGEYVAARTGAPPGPAEAPIEEALRPGKPVLVIVGKSGCRECDELEGESMKRPEVARVAARFTVAPRNLAGAWARANDVGHAPALVMLDAKGKEVFRTEGYLRPFHLAAALDYVASGAYRAEPNYQRYLQKRVESMHARGETVDLWK